LRREIVLIFFCICVLTCEIRAEVRLPAIFGDNMVLQQSKRVKIWGHSSPAEKISVEMEGKRAETIGDSSGRWNIEIGPFKSGGPYQLKINSLTFSNVLVGEVWLASGQSNMEWPLSKAHNAERELSSDLSTQVRLFKVKRRIAHEPMHDMEGSWVVCDRKSAEQFSAVAYFFAKGLHKSLGMPIGLIQSAWGGTPIEAWTSLKELNSNNEFMAKQVREENPKLPGVLYNGMISPLIPFSIRGVIWYQGESNVGRAEQYKKLFPAMIRSYRKEWGYSFPFLFVQLANFKERKDDPTDSDWARLREAQLVTLSTPLTGMAVAIDIGEANDIHPRNKQDVGERLALHALKLAYGKKILSSGPSPGSISFDKGSVRILFNNVGSGLASLDNGPLRGFAIAGADRRFVWASAALKGNSVVLTSEKISRPVAVRYAWADNPDCNLINKEGLPASPFRSDDWPK
jgi:sialate O-acetylesterase